MARVSALTILLALLIAPALQAQEVETNKPLKINQEGEYSGVSPDSLPKESTVPKKRPKRPSVTWIGFQGGDEEQVSKVFVQLSHSIEPTQSVVGKELVVAIPGVRLATANARRPIYTQFFPTSVSSMYAKRGRGNKVELRLRFKEGMPQPLESQINKGPNGYYYLMLLAP